MIRSFLLLMLPISTAAVAEVTDLPTGGFEISHEIVVPGTPETAWDEFTGDVSGWWDHTHSEAPAELVIEGRPGGQFYERFDERGNGAIHADIIFADRGKKLVMDGPLGFSGHPLDLVCTIEFTPEGADRVRVKATCRAAGELQEGWADAVDRVWHHFLVEQFKAWMEDLAHGG